MKWQHRGDGWWEPANYKKNDPVFARGTAGKYSYVWEASRQVSKDIPIAICSVASPPSYFLLSVLIHLARAAASQNIKRAFNDRIIKAGQVYSAA